jgi:hypothetical protein
MDLSFVFRLFSFFHFFAKAEFSFSPLCCPFFDMRFYLSVGSPELEDSESIPEK